MSCASARPRSLCSPSSLDRPALGQPPPTNLCSVPAKLARSPTLEASSSDRCSESESGLGAAIHEVQLQLLAAELAAQRPRAHPPGRPARRAGRALAAVPAAAVPVALGCCAATQPGHVSRWRGAGRGLVVEDRPASFATRRQMAHRSLRQGTPRTSTLSSCCTFADAAPPSRALWRVRSSTSSMASV